MKNVSNPVIPTKKLAYLCGVFAGDGSISYRKNKNEYLLKCVGNPKDEKSFYIEIVKPFFKETFLSDINVRMMDSETTFGFSFYSKQLVNYLTNTIGLPLGKKYSNLKIPEIFKKDKGLLTNFIKGVFDTDGCICFKKKYKQKPYYPVISISSKSRLFVSEIAKFLKDTGFRVYETYDYRRVDKRANEGFTEISRIELNGVYNLRLWISTIGFYSPKHREKIKNYWEEK